MRKEIVEKERKDWEHRWDELAQFLVAKYGAHIHANHIKLFIKTLLKEQKQEIKKAFLEVAQCYTLDSNLLTQRKETDTILSKKFFWHLVEVKLNQRKQKM